MSKNTWLVETSDDPEFDRILTACITEIGKMGAAVVSVVGLGDVTIARVTIKVCDEMYDAVATARRSSEDVSDPAVGQQIAVGRAFRQLGREMLRDGYSRMEYNARVAESAEKSQQEGRRKLAEKRLANRKEWDAKRNGQAVQEGLVNTSAFDVVG